MKREEGSLLIISFAVIIILLTLITGIGRLINNEIHISRYEENRAKAFYIAEAGLEYACKVFEEDSFWDTQGNLISGQRNRLSDLFAGTLLRLNRTEGEDNTVIVTSSGAINDVEVNLEMEIIKEESGGIFDKAIYADRDITMSNGRIKGDIFLNTGSLTLNGNPTLDGDVYLGSDADPEECIFYPNWYNFTSNVYRGEERNYTLPEFPQFLEEPTGIASRSNLYYNWDNTSNTISNSGHYQEINVSNNSYELNIDIYNEDIVLIADEGFKAEGDVYINRFGSGDLYLFANDIFEFKKEISISNGTGEIYIIADSFKSGGSSHFNIDYVEGNGKVQFYIKEQFSLTGSSTVNNTGNAGDLMLYYKGDSKILLPGATKFVGSVYAEKADINVTGSGGIKGHIITGGENVSIRGGSSANVRALLAPNAAVSLNGSGALKGAIVCEEISLTGGASVEYNNQFDFDLPDMGSDEIELAVIWHK